MEECVRAIEKLEFNESIEDAIDVVRIDDSYL